VKAPFPGLNADQPDRFGHALSHEGLQSLQPEMSFESGIIKTVAFPLSDLSDPLLADAVRLFGIEQCIAQFCFSGFQCGDLATDVGYLVGRVTIGHRCESGMGCDFHWLVFLLLAG